MGAEESAVLESFKAMQQAMIDKDVDARVYGMSCSWTLPTNARFVKVDGRWIQCN